VCLSLDVPEQTVLGNNNMLVTIGKHGELRYLFWPTIDYPQHIQGSLPGLFYSFTGEKSFDWLTDPIWTKKQKYVSDVNIVRTSFEHQKQNLRVTLDDAVLPNSDVLIRRFEVQNGDADGIFLRFFYYNDLSLSESTIDDEAHYVDSHDSIIHYKRDVYFGYSGTMTSSGHQCGVHGESSDSFSDVYDYRLSGGSLTLYDGLRDVNSCFSWDLGNLKSNDTKTLAVITALGKTEKETLSILKKSKDTALETQFRDTEEFWKKWIYLFRTKIADSTLTEIAKRSLLVLKLLSSKTHGGIIAAPCMDPEYRFCWPRDATFVAYAFDRCFYRDEAEEFYKWCSSAQEDEGGLYQRYYIEARLKGPCWSSQIDEVATVLWGMGKHVELTQDQSFVQSLWATIKKGAEFLDRQVSNSNGLVETVGLWEEKFGQHTYSNAAICAGLKAAAQIAEFMKEEELKRKWSKTAIKVKELILSSAWDSSLNRFVKTVSPRDDNLDVSLLSLTYPFEILPANDERMKKTASALESAFGFNSGGIGRYPFDQYYGGNPWILATLWMALYNEKLGEFDKARADIEWVINHKTEADMLSEQIDKQTAAPISAVPLAWSHAFFILSVLDLDQGKVGKLP
jgi:glucoamylase